MSEFKATRWILVTRTMATEVAITTSNGKRLRKSTRAEIMAHLRNPAKCTLYPLAQSVRVTPRAPTRADETRGGK